MMNIGGANLGKALLAAAGAAPQAARPSSIGHIDPAKLHKLMQRLQKAMYILALHQAIERAEKSGSFNLEVHKNDLWTKLGNMQPNRLAGHEVTHLVQQNQQMIDLLSQITKKMGDASKGVINAIGR